MKDELVKGLGIHNDRLSSGVDRALQPQNISDVVIKKRLGEQIVARVNDLPSLSVVVTQIMELINNDKSSASNFERFLRQDQGLAARLLRIVNSSFFGLRNKISSIPQAIVLVGYNSLKNLVLAASASKLMQGAFPEYGFMEKGLWQHSFMCATWSKKIALDLGIDSQSAEELFVAGLLHDVGKLVLAKYLKDCKEMYAQIIASDGNLEDAEETLFGITHAEIGAKVAEKWNFSQELSDIIRYHHTIDDTTLGNKRVLLVNLVDTLLGEGMFGMYENFPGAYNVSEQCLDILGITPDMLDEYRIEIAKSADKWEEI